MWLKVSPSHQIRGFPLNGGQRAGEVAGATYARREQQLQILGDVIDDVYSDW